MKRLLILCLSAVILMMWSLDAHAICQKCNNDHTPQAMCWTLDACESGATMSACVVKEVENSTNLYCDDMGTDEGEECNGADSSCSPGGGGDDDFPGGGGGDCEIGVGEYCPAQCSTCTYNLDPW